MSPRDPYLERFLLALAAQRSPRTVDAYRRDLEVWFRFLDRKKLRVARVGSKDVTDYLGRLRDGRAPVNRDGALP